MKIVKVAIRRFMGISDLEVSPGPGLNVVRGANGTGKTSFLRAMLKALMPSKGRTDGPWVIHRLRDGGAEAEPPTNGADSAEILVELDGGLMVRRSIREGGTQIQVTKREGPLDVEVRSPAEFLRTLISGNALNPVEFFRAPAAERRRILLSVVPPKLTGNDIGLLLTGLGVDEITARKVLDGYCNGPIGLAELREIDDALMELRRAAWGEKEHHEEAAVAEVKKLPPNYVAALIPAFGDIMARLDAANATMKAVDDAKAMLAAAEKAVGHAEDLEKQAKGTVDELELRLASARVAFEDAAASRLKITDDKFAAQDLVRKIAGKAIDPAPIKAELAAYEEAKAYATAHSEASKHNSMREAMAERVRTLDSAMRDGVRTEAPRLLWSRLEGTPLGGMDVGMKEDRITVGGIDVDALSTSEQIRFAAQVALATLGDLKTVCVDGFEALDPAHRAEFARVMSDAEVQCFVSEVDDGALRVEVQ